MVNYENIYNKLIERGQSRILQEYTEKHHIIPKCLGGSDDPENLVDLTPEEHYVAHQLLVKMYPENHSLAKAAQMMIPNRPNNKMYGWLKRRFSKAMSESQSGRSNSQYGSRWIHNPKTLEARKTKDELPDGWDYGRKPKVEKVKKPKYFAISDKIANELLYDYEIGLPMKDILIKYNRSSEQSVTTFLTKRFPNRKRFKPNEREQQVVGVEAA